MGIILIAVGLFAGFGTAYLASDDVRYLTRAGLEETRILRNARPLDALIAEETVPESRRHLLRLVRDVRHHADTLGLTAGDTYTTFSDVGRDTLLLVLSAAPRDCICPVTWKYPIVGRVPYKGFFDPRMAERERDRLAARGHDTSLRPSAAFSTLGWFKDPLLSTALLPDSVELAALVFHEMAHNTLFVKSATAFNESFAQMVGYRAAEHFFATRGDSSLAARARARWQDEIVLGEYYDALVGRLTRFYNTKPDSATLDSGRVAIGRWARDLLRDSLASRLSFSIGRLADRPINNATLIGVQLYRTHLDRFDRFHQRHDRNLAVTVDALRALVGDASGEDAFRRLEEALGPPPSPPPDSGPS